MTTVEYWQISTAAAQAVVGILAVGAAWVIGLRQVRISKTQAETAIRQADIAGRQTEVQEALVFGVVVEVVYNTETHRFDVHNRGQTPISIWGTQLWENPPIMETEPRFIAPGGFYFLIPAPGTVQAMQRPLDGAASVEGRYRLFLKNQTGRKYLVSISVRRERLNGNPVTLTQTLGMGPSDW